MFAYKKDNFNVPIKSWIPKNQYFSDVPMVEQCENLAKLPFAFHHVVLCSDGHVGYGMPIGGVLATRDIIVPNAVGVDIGCGLRAVKTPLREIDQATLKKIMSQLRRAIPLGFAHHRSPQPRSLMPPNPPSNSVVEKEYQNALFQLGTLGGGNHFLEIQQGSDGFVWLMLHSGSRNFGYKVAAFYHRRAKKYDSKFNLPSAWDLSPLPLDSVEGQKYLAEMNYCLDFALANRRLMMDRFIEIVAQVAHSSPDLFDPIINIAHNYAAPETHFGQKVWVHRKGATKATPGLIGIIPGSQGSESFIVEGLGHPDSFHSCSHGAGRRLGRNQARKTLDLQQEIANLNQQGIIHAIRSVRDLDEAPGAYKDINDVMRHQSDLVDIRLTLKPLAVIKA